MQINTSVTATANFTDLNTQDTHTAVWDWGDESSSSGTVTETNGSGSVTDSHVYTEPGIYKITLSVTDNDGASGTSTFQYVSAYDSTPQGLFSAARIFDSPAGAYLQNPTLTGRVMFGVTAKYSGSAPTGRVELNFQAANLNFSASDITSLVIASGKATLRGNGTLNGVSGYSYLITGIDSGQTIRFQIKNSSNNVVYDTQPGAADIADPITAVTGQVIVH